MNRLSCAGKTIGFSKQSSITPIGQDFKAVLLSKNGRKAHCESALFARGQPSGRRLLGSSLFSFAIDFVFDF
jgi:hypothetical protein